MGMLVVRGGYRRQDADGIGKVFVHAAAVVYVT